MKFGKPPPGIKGSHRATTARIRAAVAQRDGHNCWLCGLPFAAKEKPTLDHIKPVSMGGSNRVSNLKLAHYSCNTRRGNTVATPTQVIPRQADHGTGGISETGYASSGRREPNRTVVSGPEGSHMLRAWPAQDGGLTIAQQPSDDSRGSSGTR